MTQSTKDGVTTTYTYNGDGLRMSKTTNGVTTSFILDGADVVAEIKGNEITVYSRGLGLVSQTKGDTTKTYFSDDHGNVTGMYSSATDGEEALYDGFGNILFNDSSDNPFGYCGEYYDEETGLIYLRARYYDPETGRFISEDPAMDGTNWYVYCSNNPVKFVDPWGLWENGDENLSQGAQAYTTYYGYKWDDAYARYQSCISSNDSIGAAVAQSEMDYWHELAEDIRTLDLNGLVKGVVYNVPLYNQGSLNLCWAYCQTMVECYDNDIVLTQSDADVSSRTIAESVHGSIDWNKGGWPTNSIDVIAQTPTIQNISNFNDISNALINGPIYAYYNNAPQPPGKKVSAHLIVITGAVSAIDHQELVTSNNPQGESNIQTYIDFVNGIPNDMLNMKLKGVLR